MKKQLSYLIILLVLASCGRHESSYTHDAGEKIKVDVMLPVTPVKDQGKTELCWAYAMLAAIETDRLAMGDSVNLSPQWLARHSLEEQALDSYLTGRKMSLRGTLPEAMRLLQQYGIVAWDAYHPECNAKTATRRVEHLASTFSSQQRGLTKLQSSLADMLDEEMAPAPRYVFMLGAEYTPLEFAHSVCMPGDWTPYTSFTHHPFGKPCIVEVPDNRQRHTAVNVPVDTLISKVRESLRRRHPVAWEGCMKNNAGTIKYHKSFAQNARQDLFERHILTDDHCMTIVGMGHAANGTRYFICKNSWGVKDGRHGYRYMSEQQFVLSTIMIMVKN